MKMFVPGRICLLGEHSDWAGGYRRTNAEIEKGYTLLTGTDQGRQELAQEGVIAAVVSDDLGGLGAGVVVRLGLGLVDVSGLGA